ncbi:hypothetical protein CEV34_4493 [Brucella pseudogrignonensis]|uniref:Uncharacterized protein n=1 Tax=Brucella pseudogrignonensis TaxID=419475 RepID=A0A256G4Y0_9HYPH|nr:hypothetical protein CEV34_4493 [Brucella pseudogrignonensis]
MAWFIPEKALRICFYYGMILQHNRNNLRGFCVYRFGHR